MAEGELTTEELGTIEKMLDSAKIPSGTYRDGFRDGLKMVLLTMKDEKFQQQMGNQIRQYLRHLAGLDDERE